jgi:Carboxypeptidase regulatory-like domain
MFRTVAFCMWVISTSLFAAEPDPSKGRVEGVVVDEAGKPVAGATVRASRWQRDKADVSDKTVANGSFRLVFDSPTVQIQRLIASADGGKRQGFVAIDYSANDQVTNVRIVLKPARTLTVRVVNELKDPVLAASVSLLEYSLPLMTAETDRQGVAAIQCPQDLKITQIAAVKSGVGFDYYENYRSAEFIAPLTPPKQVTLTLAGARTVRLRAEDSHGKPLPNIEFVPSLIFKKDRLSYSTVPRTVREGAAKTDRQGIATFDWFPPFLNRDTPFACISSEWYEPHYTQFDPAYPERQLVTGLLRYATLNGIITFPDGKPAAGILLQVEGFANGSYRRLARTNAEGKWSVQVNPGMNCFVTPTSDDWAAKGLAVNAAKEGEAIAVPEIRLGKGTLIQGRVTVGKDKKPVIDGTVTLIREGRTLVRWAKTDMSGYYRIRLGEGLYMIQVEKRIEPLEVREQPAIERSFHLDRWQFGQLSGAIKLADGKPAASARIQTTLQSAPGYASAQGLADDQGNYRLTRSTDKAWFYASDPDGTQAGIIFVDEDTEKIDLVLARAGAILGQLVEPNGQPVIEARIYCLMTVGQGKDAKHARLETTTDNSGRFYLGGAIVGSECQIKVWTRFKTQDLHTVKMATDKLVNVGRLEFDKN